MSCREINLDLRPAACSADVHSKLQTYVYAVQDENGERFPASMTETVRLDQITHAGCVGVTLTPDEARVLANQLLQCADVADEHRARRQGVTS